MNERLDNAFIYNAKPEPTHHVFEDSRLKHRAVVQLRARIGRRADRTHRAGVLRRDSDTHVYHSYRNRSHHKLSPERNKMVRRDFRQSDYRRARQ